MIRHAYPAAFAASYVLLSFAATPTPMAGLWRPLLIAILGTLVLQLLVTLALRDARRAAIATSVVVLVLGAAWLLVAVAVVAALWLGVLLLRRRSGARTPAASPAEALYRGAGIFAAIFVSVAAISAAPPALQSVDLAPPRAASGDAEGGPDIYMLLLDGYPRSDVLLDTFGYDNAWFEAELAGRGFEVAAASRSNYTSTWASLASMLNARYLEDIEELQPPPQDAAEQYQVLMRAINRSAGVRDMRDRGYVVATIPPPFESAALVSADRYLATGQMTSFEVSLLQHSLLGRLVVAVAPDLILDQQRERLAQGLEALTSITADDPLFVLAHLMSPHAPVLFGPEGQPAELDACFPSSCSIWAFTSDRQWEGLAGQVNHLNRLVLDALDELIATSPDAVVIVMSDHGHQRPNADPAQAFMNLFAARTPGRAAVFDEDVSPVNVLPALHAYFDGAGQSEAYRAWVSAAEQPLTLTPYP